ncbi:MAG: hypothetical protein O3C20_16210 [Verrucomicrobia bacterium]|nr:hypothetical protein [Verrucomicrobiota bacterium]
MKPKIMISAVFFFILLAWFLIPQSFRPSQETEERPTKPGLLQTSLGSSKESPASDLTSLEDKLRFRLLGELETLKQVHGELEGQAVIKGLFTWLDNEPSEIAAKSVQAVLESGVDAFAFGRFSPGADGFLQSYPTFRTALLDRLEKLDPALAVEVGKAILNASEKVDEWAISLRTLSRHGASRTDEHFLNTKVQELLLRETWLEEPTFSFLHAFDAAVQAGQLASIERLGELMTEPPNRAVGHAATISVDRFFQQHAAVGANYLVEHPDFLNASSGFRATLIARVNPINSNEMAVAERYLDTQAFSEEEKRTFLQTFPNFNSTFSFNLITGSLLIPREVMRERSVAAYNQLSVWLNEDRYPEFKDEITNTVNRLARTWKL